MRITTQMMNASAQKAGITLGGNSLLNYVNGNSTMNTQSALLNSLNTTQVSKTERANYEKLEESADVLAKSLMSFLEEGKEDKFSKKTVGDFVEQYNSLVNTLKKNDSQLNNFYREMLDEAVKENAESLETIGITVNKNGTLGFDAEKFECADADTVKKVLGENGTVSVKAAFIVGRIGENAAANIESYSTRYSANGYSYAASNSKCDFWG